MCHDITWGEGNVVSSLDVLVLLNAERIFLNNLLCEGLWRARCREGGENGCGRGIL